MLSRYIPIVCTALCFAWMPGSAPAGPAPQQNGYDREASAREYVQGLVVEVDQWTKDFPHQFYMAATRPPVDSSKLSDSVKAGAAEFGDSVKRLASLSTAKDVVTNAEFKDQLDKTLAAGKQVNQALGSQRFPDVLQNKWELIRTNLNSLAQIYKLDTLAYLTPPAGRGGGGQAVAAKVPGGISGYIVDQSCALKGKGMWTNATCIARCVRDGDKVVLVTEEGKIYQIANPDKIDSDAYGQKVTVTGKTDADTITVANLQM
jgi:hypothetical protein